MQTALECKVVMDTFSKRLREERKSKGYTQRQIAEMLGISQSAYKGYELIGEKNGREPSIDMIRKIATTLNTTTDYLILGRE